MPSATRLLKYWPNVLHKQSSDPIELVFFVTHRCTAQCSFCFDWPRRYATKARDELTIDEIARVSASMDKLVFLFLTGGEAFLRPDLAEIAKIFCKNNGVYKIQIPSNGWLTDRTIKTMEHIATTCPDTHSSVSISIDAIGEAHDRNRSTPRLYARAIETLKEMQCLARVHSNIGVNVNLTLSANNQGTAMETYRYLTEELNVENVLLLLVRGETKDPETKKVKLEIYDQLVAAARERFATDERAGYSDFGFAGFANQKDVLKYKEVRAIAGGGKRSVPCVAGTLYGILYANGSVEFCEMRHLEIGNVRDFDYDLPKLWKTKRANELKRAIVHDRCTCTHECAIAASLATRPAAMARVVSGKLVRDARLLASKAGRALRASEPASSRTQL